MTVDASSLRAHGRVCLDERTRGLAIRGRSGDQLAMVQNVAHSRGEALRGEGFLEKGKFERLRVGVAGHNSDLHFRVGWSDALGQFGALHLGHDQIGEHEVDAGFAFDNLQGL